MAKSEKVRLQDAELNTQIKRLVAIRPVANEYNALCKSIKEELLARKIDEYKSPEGHLSKIKRSPKYTWVVEALRTCLSRALFQALCPNKPDSKKLNQRMLACPEDKKLAACRVKDGEERELEVLSAETLEAAAG
ncbi:MAG: hypothetical protein AMXMBFR7_33180 [Planctomycetota bacterium]